jgi:hypothetical protein
MLRDQGGHARWVAAIADGERRARRDRPIEAGGEIVEQHDALSGIDERVNHVATNIAGAADDQDRHAVNWLLVALGTAKNIGSELNASMVLGGTRNYWGKGSIAAPHNPLSDLMCISRNSIVQLVPG